MKFQDLIGIPGPLRTLNISKFGGKMGKPFLLHNINYLISLIFNVSESVLGLPLGKKVEMISH